MTPHSPAAVEKGSLPSTPGPTALSRRSAWLVDGAEDGGGGGKQQMVSPGGFGWVPTLGQTEKSREIGRLPNGGGGEGRGTDGERIAGFGSGWHKQTSCSCKLAQAPRLTTPPLSPSLNQHLSSICVALLDFGCHPVPSRRGMFPAASSAVARPGLPCA